MATARDLIKNKSVSQILSISPNATMLEAIKMMAKYNVGALLVEAVADKVMGILTERDVVLRLDAQGRSAADTKVSEVMTEKVLYVESNQSVEECMELMNSKGIRHLPVYQSGELLGLISIRDVLREVISEQKTMISHLENYISGL
ncbi:MAG: CBS domain-containing protein [Chloroflexi bacterium]|nr:CBS domain-containing protein [Chloroflexota bacterium]